MILIITNKSNNRNKGRERENDTRFYVENLLRDQEPRVYYQPLKLSMSALWSHVGQHLSPLSNL